MDVVAHDVENEVHLAEAIVFPAAVAKVQNMVDHGLRVTLDLSEGYIMQAAMLMECQRMGVVLEITATPITQNEAQGDTPDGKKARPETKSLRGG